MRAVRILPTKMLGVVADHGDWPVERISIGCGMGQLSIEPEDSEDKSAKIAKNKLKRNQDETIGAEQQQKWWVGSAGHDDTLRMTDLEGFFRGAEKAETGKGALAADVQDDDSDTEVDEKLEEESQEKPEIKTESDNSGQHEGESSGEFDDIPLPKKRKRKGEKDALNTMKKHKGKKSIAVERSFFDDL